MLVLSQYSSNFYKGAANSMLTTVAANLCSKMDIATEKAAKNSAPLFYRNLAIIIELSPFITRF